MHLDAVEDGLAAAEVQSVKVPTRSPDVEMPVIDGTRARQMREWEREMEDARRRSWPHGTCVHGEAESAEPMQCPSHETNPKKVLQRPSASTLCEASGDPRWWTLVAEIVPDILTSADDCFSPLETGDFETLHDGTRSRDRGDMVFRATELGGD
jgi:hypothetical protein